MPDAAHDFLSVPGFQVGFDLIRFLNEIKWSLVKYTQLWWFSSLLSDYCPYKLDNLSWFDWGLSEIP